MSDLLVARPPRLSSFNATKLFGQFDHNIKIRTDERITAIIGPNGRGKTVCLRLIDALYKRRLSVFVNIDFYSLQFDFDNESSVRIEKIDESALKIPDEEPSSTDVLPLAFTFWSSGEEVVTWRPPAARLNKTSMQLIAFHIPFLTRESPRTWSDDRTGERYTGEDIAERFAHMLPKSFFSDLSDFDPPGFREIIAGVDCHFIETQRLLATGPSTDTARMPSEWRSRRQPNDSRLVVEQKAQKLKEKLKDQLAKFGDTSQRLDRSFPRRVLEADLTSHPTQSEISAQLRRLEDERKALTKAGFIDVELDSMVVPERFDERLSSVLEIYVKDTQDKLDVFNDLRQKIDLFVRIISDRFTGKAVDISREEGFTLKSIASGKNIPLDKLSSGEQHQLVLLFELLFEMEPNSLILIDEPELSLHVRWQKEFISDLKQIILLNKSDVILATHSPQLISHWRELIVSLGSVYRH